MADRMTPEQRSHCMSRIRDRNTKPELAVRRKLHALGFRFRLHQRNLPGRPDVVLPKWKTAVFVHGCFWHGHAGCPLFRWPSSRQEYWHAKIGGNMVRDRVAVGNLLAQGWRVVRVWECAVKGKRRKDPDAFATSLNTAIRSSNAFVEVSGTVGPAVSSPEGVEPMLQANQPPFINKLDDLAH